MNDIIELNIDNNPFDFSLITETNVGKSFNVSDFSVGDIICVSDLYDELIRRFGSYEKAKSFYEMAYTLINKGVYATYGVKNSIPYIDFNIYIEEEVNDIGILTSNVEKWIPGKKYHIGDVVYFSKTGKDEDMSCYKLVNGGTKTVINKRKKIAAKQEVPLLDSIQISEEIYNSYVEWNKDPRNIKKDIYINSDGLYFMNVPYFSGYYDENSKLTYFDTIENGSIVFNHWEECVAKNDIPTSEKIVKAITESMLDNIKRKKKDIDNTNKTLPFVFHYNKVLDKNNGIYASRELDKTCTELQYMPGFVNQEITSSGELISDVTYSIEFFTDNYMEKSCGRFDIYNSIDKPITTSDLTENPKVIRFTYYIDSIIEIGSDNVNWDIKKNTGVEYVESYNVSIETYDVLIPSGETESVVSLPYFKIGDKIESSDSNYNSDLQRNVTFSDITYTEEQVINDMFFNVGTYKEDALIGVHNLKNNINAKVERGKASSFEKHNALGEICTMQDLEHYRNDFFRITDKK